MTVKLFWAIVLQLCTLLLYGQTSKPAAKSTPPPTKVVPTPPPARPFDQKVSAGNVYTLKMLSQEPVQIIKTASPSGSREVGDTTFTLYDTKTVDFKTYFVNGPQYDNIFNPNPTGMCINGKYFHFYCGLEMSIRQNFSNILELTEFNYLGKNYLMLINFREDCLGEGCRYRCYNLFDITDKERPKQIAFSSVFEGIDTFGEFNNDGNLDFVRVAPKPPDGYKSDEPTDHYLITVYSIPNGEPVQLANAKGHPHYMWVKGDEGCTQFKVIQADWFIPLKDTSGQEAKTTSYFAEYIAFDPLYRYLYNPDGVRVEKNRWSVFISDLNDLEAAQEMCRQIQENDFQDVYIMIDQYSSNIKYQIFVGNFMSKEKAMQYQAKLKALGYAGRIADLRSDY
ncbi:MAG: SPOR domain-containing protein [Cytophagales bacterium]|nr:SPOR domain-containing protein [Cytophagales bacterium]MDW8385158.1 SPOR domain-containing protein [Flammeovirgaceae bacterium]